MTIRAHSSPNNPRKESCWKPCLGEGLRCWGAGGTHLWGQNQVLRPCGRERTPTRSCFLPLRPSEGRRARSRSNASFV